MWCTGYIISGVKGKGVAIKVAFYMKHSVFVVYFMMLLQ
jgi:hypothetical protein